MTLASHQYLTRRQMASITKEEQLGQILALLGENSKGINELKSSMTEMTAMKTDLLLWKPKVDNRVHELKHAVLNLGERIEQVLGSRISLAQPLEPTHGEQSGEVTIAQPSLTTAIREDHFVSPSVKASSSAHLEFHPSRAAPGSLDHGKRTSHRGADFGAVYTIAPEPAPVTGATPTPPKSTPVLLHTYDSGYYDRLHYSHYPPLTPFPEVEFHKFDGSNPRLWIKRCETYFDVYQTDPSLWVRLATMRLVGSAALWFQTMQTAISKMSWESFVVALCNRFDKDEHNHLLRHFFHIKQTTIVSEYVEQFSDIVHQLLAHDPSFPATVITNRFLDGLKKDVRAVVMMHGPQDLDTASSLAFLQEEASQDQPIRRSDLGSYSKRNNQEPVKAPFATSSNFARIVEDKKPPDPGKTRHTGEDKLTTLKNYRRSKGLCFKCGEKWGPNHKCPPSMSLNAIEDI